MMKIPIITATLNSDGQTVFYCDFCKRFHYHGNGSGHRIAHCHNYKSPYLATGYYLKVEKEGDMSGRDKMSEINLC